MNLRVRGWHRFTYFPRSLFYVYLQETCSNSSKTAIEVGKIFLFHEALNLNMHHSLGEDFVLWARWKSVST